MKNKHIALVLAILLMATIAAWGQNPLVSGSGTGHVGNRGCVLCHTPHSNGAILTPSPGRNSGITITNTPDLANSLAPGTTAADIPAGGIMLAKTNMGVAGNIYLWANPISPVTYTTWDGTQISGTSATLTTGNAVVHTLMCMSCHDFSNGTHDMGYSTMPGLTPSPAGTANAAYVPGVGKGTGRTFWDKNNALNNGWGPVGSLQNSHPVHAEYPQGVDEYWHVTVNGTKVSFNETSFPLGDGANTGHPARLYGEGGKAYVECTSCHNPHRFDAFAYQNGATWVVGGAGSTEYYLRGPYSAASGAISAGFCRSCHYDKTQQ